MRNRVAIALAGALIAAIPATPAGHAQQSLLPSGTKVQVYKGSLSFPIDMAWVPGTKRIYFTEKETGRVRILQGRTFRGTCVDLPVATDGEQGALGIVLHPRYKETRWLYVMYTNASPEEMRVTRFKVINNRCVRPKHILTGVPASSGYHNGGQLEFLNGRLFVSTGENHSRPAAQDLTNRLGKILRFNADGSIPSTNPFGNAVWSYGHRNPFGLAKNPRKDLLYETENGPECDDELNLIRKGDNYGWGTGYRCGTAGVGAAPRPPIRRWSSIIVPTDPWWYRGRMRSLSGSLYVGSFQPGHLRRINLNSDGTRVVSDNVILNGENIVDVSKGPGGWLYFMTPTAIKRIVPS